MSEPTVEYLNTVPVTGAVAQARFHANALVAAYDGIEVRSDSDYQLAAGAFSEVKRMRAQLSETRMSITRPLDTAKKGVMDLFRPIIERVDGTLARIQSECVNWKREQERLAEVEAARRRAKAEAEERVRRNAEIAEAIDTGQTAEAQALESMPVEINPIDIPPVVPTTPKVAGISTRTYWKFRVIDAAKIPREFLIPDEKALQAMATVRKGRAVVPGVEFYAEEKLARTGR